MKAYAANLKLLWVVPIFSLVLCWMLNNPTKLPSSRMKFTQSLETTFLKNLDSVPASTCPKLFIEANLAHQRLFPVDDFKTFGVDDTIFHKKFCGHKLKVNMTPTVCIHAQRSPESDSKAVGSGGVWVFQLIKIAMDGLFKSDVETCGSGVSLKPVLIDLGANIGLFTLAAAASGFNVIAVEPREENYIRLCTSIALNKFEDRVIFLRRAISDHGDACIENKLSPNSPPGHNHVMEKTCNGTEADVPTVTLNSFQKLIPIEFGPVPIVLKIDIEQYEPYAIVGGKNFIKTHNIVLILIEWTHLKLREASKYKFRSDLVAKTVEAMEFLLFEMKYSVFSAQPTVGKRLSWRDRENWPPDIYLIRE